MRMRPDVSLSIAPKGVAPAERTWIHFDAKYKVKQYTKDFADEDNEQEAGKHVLPADIQKMHSYRDAIRRSAGAYVIYPGNKKLEREQYHELLPGLGAFALRPTSTGDADADSSNGLRRFILDVVDHLGSQGTSYQRDRYWRSAAHGSPGYRGSLRTFIQTPPSDTRVLLGYLRGAEHAAAVHTLGLYNLRAEPGREGSIDLQSDELGAELLVLYGRGTATVYRATGEVVLRRRDDLEVEGYEPQGDLYLCLQFDSELLFELGQDAIEHLAVSKSGVVGAPAAVMWSDVEPDKRKATSD